MKQRPKKKVDPESIREMLGDAGYRPRTGQKVSIRDMVEAAKARDRADRLKPKSKDAYKLEVALEILGGLKTKDKFVAIKKLLEDIELAG